MDAVRCFCMLYGLLVHGATIGDRPLFHLIDVSSEYFRMVTFFLVSGFFSAMVAARRPALDFFRHRARMLLVPLFAGLLLLNPITNWLALAVHGHPLRLADWAGGGWRLAAEVVPLHSNWHLHLWFLFCLFFYALLTPALNRLFHLSPAARFARLLRERPMLAPLLLAAAVGGATVLLRAVHDQWFEQPAGSHPFQFILMASFGYLPFFAVGALAFAERPVLDALHRLPLFGLLVFGAAHAGWSLVEPHLPWAIGRAGHFFFRAGFMLMIVMTILCLARKYFSRGGKTLSMLTDSVYSFYLFHLLFIYIVATLMLKITDNPYLIFATILITGYPLLLAFHVKGIAKSPYLLWLFNGKPWPRATKPVKAPAPLEGRAG